MFLSMLSLAEHRLAQEDSSSYQKSSVCYLTIHTGVAQSPKGELRQTSAAGGLGINSLKGLCHLTTADEAGGFIYILREYIIREK